MTLQNTLALFDQSAFVAGLIGTPWSDLGTGPDSYDCWGLAAHVQKVLFDRDLPFAADFIATAKSLRDVIDVIKASELQRSWLKVDQPRPGDLILMGRSLVPSHIGVWVEVGPGLVGVLHCARHGGVRLEMLSQVHAEWNRVEIRRCHEGAIEAVANARLTALDHVTDTPFALVVEDPLDPLKNATVMPLKVGQSIASIMAEIDDAEARWVIVNDTPLLRMNPETKENEFETVVQKDDVVWILPPLPEGDDGSQVLAALLTIVVSLAAPYLAAWATGSTVSTLSLGGKLLSAGIAVAGNLLISQFIQPSQPTPLAEPQPTYSFSTQQNRLRPGQRVPCIYGTMRRAPDLLAKPWAEYEDNDQLIHLLLSVGQGEYRINEFGVGDTAVWTSADGLTGAIADVEFEIIPPGQVPTLFPSAIEVNSEVDGVQMPEPAELEEGSGDIQPSVIGPFTAVRAGQTATELVFDFVFPNGLFSNPNGLAETSVSWIIEYRQIDDNGNAVGEWALLEEVTRSNADTTPQRLTRRYAVPKGRYQVRAWRSSESTAVGTGAQDQLVWLSLRAKIADAPSYDQVTSLALRVRADAASSSAVQEWYVDATRILPYFNDTGDLVTGPTEAIEAAALDVISADYGLALDDDQIDMPQIKALASTWRSRGDVVCTSIEGDTSAWDVLDKVLKAGRSRPFLLGGLVTFMRDEARASAPKLITHADMVRGSFEVDRLHHKRESPNVVTMRYRDRLGAMRSIECRPDGIENPRPATVVTEVMVDAEQVHREGLYMAASNNKRRRFLSFVMLGGGGAFLPGMLLDVSHPRPKYGRPARIEWAEFPILQLTADHCLDTKEGWIMISRPDMGSWGPVKVFPVQGEANQVLIDTADFDRVIETGIDDGCYSNDPRDWIITEDDPFGRPGGGDALEDNQAEATRVSVGSSSSAPMRAMVVEVIARDKGQFEVLCVEEAAEVHEAENQPLAQTDVTTAAIVNSARPTWTGVVIAGYEVDEVSRPDGVDFEIIGPIVPGAVEYISQATADIYAPDWQPLSAGSEPTLKGPVTDGSDVYVRVAVKVGLLIGEWSYFKTDVNNIINGRTVAKTVDAS